MAQEMAQARDRKDAAYEVSDESHTISSQSSQSTLPEHEISIWSDEIEVQQQKRQTLNDDVDGTLRMNDENADVDVIQRKARATHVHYCQPRYRDCLLRRAERESPRFDVVGNFTLFTAKNVTVNAFIVKMFALSKNRNTEAPWENRYGSAERGEAWANIAKSLSGMEKPIFKVSQRSVRDRYSTMEKKSKNKVRQEEGASGISPEESEVDRVMEEIIEQFEEHDREYDRISEGKKKKAEEEVAKAEEMRKQSLETYKNTQKRRDSDEPPKKKRASGSDTMNFLKERNEMEIKIRAEDRDFRREEMERKAELQQEEFKLKQQELEDRRKQNDALHQQMLLQQQQQQQLQLVMQQQQQQSSVMMALLEKTLTKK
ncbi:hypothetical protein QZH41_004590 [Actinostola sp. cb2023]|nr:hypothetical protein QZH41_004590 [Actinostola sp. cb2023]